MKAFWTLVAVLVLVAVGGLLWVGLGGVPLAADEEPSGLEERLAEWALEASIERRAPREQNPLGTSPEALAEGMEHYQEYCVMCHGATGVEQGTLGQGLYPPAPRLESEEAQEFSDGELFWITKHGIRLSGMPAFGPTHSDEQIWQMVSFVRHLPELTAEEQATLSAGVETHHEGGAEGEHHGASPAATASEP